MRNAIIGLVIGVLLGVLLFLAVQDYLKVKNTVNAIVAVLQQAQQAQAQQNRLQVTEENPKK